MPDPHDRLTTLETKLQGALNAYTRAPDVAHEVYAIENAAALVEDLRAAVLVHAVDHERLTHGAMARALNVSRQTVHNRLTKARVRVQELDAEAAKPFMWTGLTPSGEVGIYRSGGGS